MSGSGLRVRKRDRIRGIFGKPPTSVPPSAGGTPLANKTGGGSSTTPRSNGRQPKLPSQDFLADALSELTGEERSIVQEHVAHDINEAVQAAYRATKARQADCQAKRWSGSDKIDKVLHWLDRFKSVGDIASNADPIHAGLPWAGIRMLLEVLIADSRQMAALAGGMNLALGIANRLRAYFAYFQHLPPASLTTDNLYKALVGLYAHILRFLAAALRIYHANPAARRFQAIWRNSELMTFDRQCDELGQRADIEANNCDRELRATESTAAARWKDDLKATLQKLDAIQSIQVSIDALHVKVDLTKLSRVEEATYNSRTESKLSKCLAGTRSEILHNISQWVEKPDGKLIYWLCGKAGTGKSTISRTIAEMLDRQHYLGASFFFKRGNGGRGNADLFFPTIAAQLADFISEMQDHMAAALETDSFLCGKGLYEQCEKLLWEPLRNIDTARLPQQTVAIVVDALDECDRDTDIRTFIDLLTRVGASSTLDLRIFVTSRPELPVQLGFRRVDGSLHEDVYLEEVQQLTIQRDIGVYFDHEFAKMKEDRLLKRPDDSLPVDWPSKDDLQTLVELAVPLFIFASTVCRFVSEASPQKRLRLILEQRHKAGVSHLTKTYLPILEELLVGENEDEQEELLRDFRQVVGPIVLAANALSVASLASLLDIDRGDVNDRLEGLHSVLHIPRSLNEPVRPLHLSFRDFLIDSNRKNEARFWIDETETHRMLSICCLRLLNDSAVFRRDICGVVRPGTRRVELSAQQIATSIPPDIAYACSYWPLHLVNSGDTIRDNGEVHRFLQQHLLHWLEALSWLGKISSARPSLSDMRPIVQASQSNELADFLNDARTFVYENEDTVDQAPLQVYHSALVFAPTQSVVRNNFIDPLLKSSARIPKMTVPWGEKQDDAPYGALAFSPDGQVVASSSAGDSMRLWNVQTGEQTHQLERTIHQVHDVVFSPNGQVLAASGDGTVRLWNVQTGEEMQRLEGHNQDADAVAFSPNGQVVASAILEVVCLWNAQTGEQMKKLGGHESWINAVTFSPDGKIVASSSDDNTVLLCSVQTGEHTQKLVGHDSTVVAVEFSHDGQVLVSASWDWTVRLWDVQTGKQMQKLEGHEGRVLAAAISPNGQLVASISRDRTMRLWDAQTGKQVGILTEVFWTATFQIIRPEPRIRFSANGEHLLTDTGTFIVASALRNAKEDDPERTTSLELGYNWIRVQGEDRLCLPRKYRRYRSAVRGQTLVVLQSDRGVSFFRLA